MGRIWSSDRARIITVITGLLILFSLSLVVVWMSMDEMKNMAIEDCKNGLTQEVQEVAQSVDEYIDTKLCHLEAVKELMEQNFSGNPNDMENEAIVRLLSVFIEDATYLDFLVIHENGKIYDMFGNQCTDKFLENPDNVSNSVTDAFNYLVDDELRLVYAFSVPIEINGKQCKIIAIDSCENLAGVIRHYDTLRSHIQISDDNNTLMAEVIDCNIQEKHALVEEISIYDTLEKANWKVKTVVDKKIVKELTDKYTSVIFKQMLITITAFVFYFLVVVAASVSFSSEKKKIIDEMIDIIDDRDDQIAIFAEMIDAISKEYCAMYILDIRKDLFEEIVSEGEIRELFNPEKSLEEVFNQMCDTYVAPMYRDELEQFLDINTLNERIAVKGNMSLEYQTDKDMWNKMTFIVKKWNGEQPEEIMLVISDTDIEKKREEDYKQSLFEAVDVANRANNAKSNFLSKMSHDIRTPINGIVGMVDIAKKNWDNTDKVAECFEKMEDASKYLLSIVDDVLNMSKFEKGNIELEEDIVDIEKVVKECVENIIPMAQEKEIDVKIQKLEISTEKVVASTQHLKQIFANLLNNAVKYTEKGGAVRFNVEEISCNDEHASYKFTISDTGIGMGDEFIEILYEPFTQEYENARTTYQGIGLGLSIVKGIIDKMGGTIEVKSKEGIGTTFIVSLTMPLVSSKKLTEETEQETCDLAGKTFLVVEDNEINMEIAVFMLEEAGVNVLMAENGKEGVDVFEQSEPGAIDMILMDVMMPVIDGIEATKLIRQMDRPDAVTIPILAMTANAFPEDVMAVKNVGMNDHIPKPIVMEKFFEKINCWIK